jgi:hypothetical protein
MNHNLSQATKHLLDEARNIAIDLGYDHISTIHIFLADCNSNRSLSIKDFVFKNNEELHKFSDSQRIGDSTIFLDSLPITIEAEKTIRKGIRLMKTVYKANEVYPYHLFLAASQLKESMFYAILQPKEGLFERLEKYYIEKGAINKVITSKSLWARLFRTNK